MWILVYLCHHPAHGQDPLRFLPSARALKWFSAPGHLEQPVRQLPRQPMCSQQRFDSNPSAISRTLQALMHYIHASVWEWSGQNFKIMCSGFAVPCSITGLQLMAGKSIVNIDAVRLSILMIVARMMRPHPYQSRRKGHIDARLIQPIHDQLDAGLYVRCCQMCLVLLLADDHQHILQTASKSGFSSRTSTTCIILSTYLL